MGKRYIQNQYGMTSAGFIEALKADHGDRRLPWIWNGPRPRFFRTKDNRIVALTPDAIDKGLPQATGIRIIDGNKLEDVEPEGTA